MLLSTDVNERWPLDDRFKRTVPKPVDVQSPGDGYLDSPTRSAQQSVLVQSRPVTDPMVRTSDGDGNCLGQSITGRRRNAKLA